jgi:hypothetical protein
MADRVLPVVRKLIVCSDATYLQVDEKANLWKWQLTEPLSVVRFPPGVTGNFDVKRLWIYAQLAEAVGEFDLRVRMQRMKLDAGTETVEKDINVESDTRRIDFGDFDRLETVDFAFEMTMVPFDTSGVYRFSVWSNYAQLPGETTDLRVLDARKTL